MNIDAQQMTVVEMQQQIMQEIQQVSFETLLEVMDFIRFLKTKPLHRRQPRRPFGSAKGLITIADDFDAPLEDFQEYMT